MQITRGIQPSALKVVVYGPEGIGKSTFLSQFPGVVFIDTEGSTKYLDVARTPKPTSWVMLLDQIKYFRDHPDQLGTLAIDTADWAEHLCSSDLCARSKKTGIEDFGYGKGYTYLAEEFGKLLNALEEVVEQGVNIVIAAHAAMRKFEQPDEMAPYDRWELKLQKKTAPLLKEWADMVLFANYETFTVKRDDGKTKAQGGKRVMYTTHHPCWDAKNRFGLAEKLSFDFGQIAHLFPSQSQQPEESSPPELSENDKKFLAEVYEDHIKKNQPPHLKALYDLMDQIGADEEEVRNIVAAKGYFPADMPVADYPEDFVSGVLVGAWAQVSQAIQAARPLPF